MQLSCMDVYSGDEIRQIALENKIAYLEPKALHKLGNQTQTGRMKYSVQLFHRIIT